MLKLKLLAVAALLFCAHKAGACTGITLKSQDGSTVVARTIEWGGSDLNSRYAIVPRGYTQSSYVPGGKKDGMTFTARYGFVGLSVEQEEFVTEGLNEEGLSAGLFYFPGYGRYEDYSEADKAASIADLQLVSWMLGSFKTVDEVTEALKGVHVVAIDPQRNEVVLGTREELQGFHFSAKNINLMKYATLPDNFEVSAKIRYRNAGFPATLRHEGNGLQGEFHTPVDSITPGQSAVFYEGPDVIGGGIIV